MKREEGRNIHIRRVSSLRSVQAKLRSSALLLISVVATACCISCGSGGSDLEARVKLLEASQAETATRLQKVTVELDSLTKGQLMAILDFIERAELHNMDEVLEKTARINPSYLVTVRKLGRMVIAVRWPTPLKDKAEAFKAALTDLEAALTSKNLKASREAVRKAHRAFHSLTDAGWKLISSGSSE